jgi:hypothetical protein
VTFVSTISEEKSNAEIWYLDTGCSNHMTGRRDWLKSIDTSKKTRVKLADSSYLVAKGMGNIAIQRKDGEEVVIEKVLYIPDMDCNLMSVGQLIENGFSLTIEDEVLKLYDQKKRLIL